MSEKSDLAKQMWLLPRGADKFSFSFQLRK